MVFQYGVGRLWWRNLHNFDGNTIPRDLLPPRDTEKQSPHRNASANADIPTVSQQLNSSRNAQAAAAAGFCQFGITPAVQISGYSALVSWIESGYAGEMQYFANRQQAYQHPNGVLQGTKSIIALSYPYEASSAMECSKGMAQTAKYLWPGVDYHDVIHPKLKELCKILTIHAPHSKARGVVDTAPLMEREIAEQAGLGWQGKNTLLLNKHHGSHFLMHSVDTELPSDEIRKPTIAERAGHALMPAPRMRFLNPVFLMHPVASVI